MVILDTSNLLTTRQLAEATGLSESTIRVYCKRKLLTPVKIGRDLFFTPQDIEILRNRSTPGRPKGSKTG